MTLRYDGKVALVTGAGAGLGRLYALTLAGRGAKVMVNDMNAEAAKKVVDEIKAAGGHAVAETHSVVEGDKIVAACLEALGGIHIIVNNAGILRDVSFAKMTFEQWDVVLKVHLYGTMSICKAAWKTLNEQKYGRIVNITSVNGLYGAFGQANYSSAKSAVVGLSKTLALEGAKSNIKVNLLAPGAGTAMTATVMPKQFVDAWKADYVAPILAFLCHEEVPCTGSIFESGGGWVSEVRWKRTPGVYFDLDKPFGPEEIKAQFSKIRATEDMDFPEDSHTDKDPRKNKQLKQIIAKLQAPKSNL
jgi:NAD(P)-dependent dehydrogenase (short-subunit alcohol dehydrogenase family)